MCVANPSNFLTARLVLHLWVLLEPACQLIGKQDVGPLGLSIRLPRSIRPRFVAEQIIKVHFAQRMALHNSMQLHALLASIRSMRQCARYEQVLGSEVRECTTGS